MREKKISESTLKRLPVYLKYLKSIADSGTEYISSAALARALNTGEVQARKDLAAVCSAGKPKVGYKLADLIKELSAFVGCSGENEAVIMGAGKLGSALLSYSGFEESGVSIQAAFDKNKRAAGKKINGKPVFHLSSFRAYVRRKGTKIGVIAVPADQAQAVCDMMVAAGIEAVWNFAPVSIKTPEHVIVKNENMAGSLSLLSGRLKDKFDNPKEKKNYGK
ncbi:redox-sensing transcriptional repressor [Parelusimicrobium proximum]|uniref:redox-sensing transcriptional repressor Rex n=1 Tax=Parelusimicrobium proximum TaxID=3228953 RepID=UPI003D168D9D